MDLKNQLIPIIIVVVFFLLPWINEMIIYLIVF